MDLEVQLPSTDNTKESSIDRVIVCRGRSCRKYDAQLVFENFKQNLPPDVELISVPCLGQCGNGAMVLIEPDGVWYWQVHPDEVKKVIEQHIIRKKPVKAMLYPQFHADS